MIGVASVASCYPRNCEPSTAAWGQTPGEGSLIDETRWQSTPIDTKWLQFPGNRLWILDIKAFGDRVPHTVNVWVSAQEDPVHEGSFAAAAGNLAEIGVQPGRILVKNGTCADYFVRVVAEVTPAADAGDGGDAGDGSTDADASATASDGGDAGDAGADASDAEAGP